MNRPLYTILILLVMLAFTPAPPHIYLKGHIKTNPGNSSVYTEGLTILIKHNDKVLGTAVTNSTGHFSLSFTSGKENSFDIFCSGLGIGTLLIASIKQFESDTLDKTFLVPIAYQRNITGKVVCPKCEKTSKVYKIAYGNGLPVRRIITKSGDTTYSNIVNGYYNEGTCIGSPAQYYCDRDKIKF